MTISELIEILKQVKDTEGDIEVTTIGEYRDVHRIYSLGVGYDDCQELKDNKEDCESKDCNKVLGIFL